jgi:murein DD-endopeptidase MepM/ murein hydrolase activator NlpD
MQSKGATESKQLESFIIKQLLKSSGAFKGTEAAGSSLTADMFADTLSEAIAGAGGLGTSGLLNPHAEPLAPQHHAGVTSGFGDRADPFTGQRSHHTGIDLAAAEGTPIPAAKDGVVIAAGPRGGYGNAIEIAHADGTSTLYAHASGVAVTPGDRVSEGDLVGWVGQTGRSTGPHLHLEVRRGGQFLDPGQALKAYRLRAEESGGGSP